MMTVFLIYIERLKPTKKFMYGMMIYGIVVPLALLPYSISTGDNAFYNLDGAFIPMVFGNNQVVISIVYVIGVTTYFYIMYVLSKVMIKHSETPQIKPLFKPLWPWVSLGVFFIVGLTVGKYFINIVPKDVRNLADQYESEPVRIMEKFGNIYEGEIDGEKVFFIYLIDKFEEVEVMDYEGNILDVQEEGDVFYYNQDDADGKVIIILYKNRGEENEKVRTYNFNN